jgi:dTDP-4-amino-4,6-dideoxygalactose transaminase
VRSVVDVLRCGMLTQGPKVVEFKHKIMWYRSLEQYISKKNNTILAFEKMWAPLQYIFNIIIFFV